MTQAQVTQYLKSEVPKLFQLAIPLTYLITCCGCPLELQSYTLNRAAGIPQLP